MFGETHAVNFYITETANEAVQRGKTELCTGLNMQHRDDVLIVDNNHRLRLIVISLT